MTNRKKIILHHYITDYNGDNSINCVRLLDRQTARAMGGGRASAGKGGIAALPNLQQITYSYRRYVAIHHLRDKSLSL